MALELQKETLQKPSLRRTINKSRMNLAQATIHTMMVSLRPKVEALLNLVLAKEWLRMPVIHLDPECMSRTPNPNLLSKEALTLLSA